MSDQSQVTKKTEANVAKQGFQLPFGFQPKSLVPANKTEWIRFSEGSVVGAIVTVAVTAIINLFKKPE